MKVPAELLKYLACPKCKGPVVEAPDAKGLVCEQCRLLFVVRDGIPVMLADEAVSLGGDKGTDGKQS